MDNVHDWAPMFDVDELLGKNAQLVADALAASMPKFDVGELLGKNAQLVADALAASMPKFDVDELLWPSMRPLLDALQDSLPKFDVAAMLGKNAQLVADALAASMPKFDVDELLGPSMRPLLDALQDSLPKFDVAAMLGHGVESMLGAMRVDALAIAELLARPDDELATEQLAPLIHPAAVVAVVLVILAWRGRTAKRDGVLESSARRRPAPAVVDARAPLLGRARRHD